jgi:group I intron endonuclease
MNLSEGIDVNCGVYRIINTVNGKFYIGSTKNAKGRKKAHFNDLKRGKHHCEHLQRAWNKEVDTAVFKFEMIIYSEKSVRIILEQKCINQMMPAYNTNLKAGAPPVLTGPLNPMFGNGKKCHFYGKPAWNKNLPREEQPAFGYKRSKETKLKLSTVHLGKPSWNKGKQLSDGHKRSLSLAKLRKIPQRHIVAKLTETDVLAILKSIEPLAILAKRYGVTTASVSDILRNRTWKYLTREKIWTTTELRKRGWTAEKRDQQAEANRNANMTAEQRRQRSLKAAQTRRQKKSVLLAEAQHPFDWPSEGLFPETSASPKGPIL